MATLRLCRTFWGVDDALDPAKWDSLFASVVAEGYSVPWAVLKNNITSKIQNNKWRRWQEEPDPDIINSCMYCVHICTQVCMHFVCMYIARYRRVKAGDSASIFHTQTSTHVIIVWLTVRLSGIAQKLKRS